MFELFDTAIKFDRIIPWLPITSYFASISQHDYRVNFGTIVYNMTKFEPNKITKALFINKMPNLFTILANNLPCVIRNDICKTLCVNVYVVRAACYFYRNGLHNIAGASAIIKP